MTGTASYTLFYHPGFASLAVHLALAELELPYTLSPVNIPEGEGRERAYLAVNPHGQVPALIETVGGQKGPPLTQCVAILESLAERHPGRGLLPEDPEKRAEARIWMSYLSTTLQETFRRFFHPEDFVDVAAHEADVRRTGERRLGEIFDWVEASLKDRGPYLTGVEPCAADYLFFMLCRWGRYLSPAPTDHPAIAALIAALAERPGVQKALRTEGVL